MRIMMTRIYAVQDTETERYRDREKKRDRDSHEVKIYHPYLFTKVLIDQEPGRKYKWAGQTRKIAGSGRAESQSPESYRGKVTIPY